MPSVNPADLKAVWNLRRDMQERMPGQQVGIGSSIYQSVNADTRAVYYHAATLEMMAHLGEQKVGELPRHEFGESTGSCFGDGPVFLERKWDPKHVGAHALHR